MQHLSNIFHIPALLLLVLLSACSSGEKVIPGKEMVKIIGDMYLADQYIECRPEFRGQMDTLLLYEAVAQRHGYTFDDYRNSVAYYLEQGDEFKKMHLKARKTILKRKDELQKELELNRSEERDREVTWMEDSLADKHINNLWKEPALRNHKWLTSTAAKENWNPTDSVAFDIPANSIWWKITVEANAGKPAADSLYPVLTREHQIWKDNHPVVETKEVPAKTKKAPAPDMKKFRKRQELEAKRMKQVQKNKETK